MLMRENPQCVQGFHVSHVTTTLSWACSLLDKANLVTHE